MKKEDFYGKYILSTPFLKPIKLTEQLCDGILVESLELLHYNGLVFDSFDKAKIAADNAIILIQDINNRTYVREEDIAEAPKKPRIYISGPISGHNIEERRKAFKEIQKQLQAQDYEPVNPMENGLPAEATTREHMKRDIELLMTCDYIYMMRQWTHSKGCKVEFDVATSIGLPVLFEQSGEIIEFI